MLDVLAESLSVLRFSADADVPAWALRGGAFGSVTRTASAAIATRCRLARVTSHCGSSRFVTMTTLPPSSCARRVNSGAPGRAVAAPRITHVFHAAGSNAECRRASSCW
jgi:hypothetical protein